MLLARQAGFPSAAIVAHRIGVGAVLLMGWACSPTEPPPSSAQGVTAAPMAEPADPVAARPTDAAAAEAEPPAPKAAQPSLAAAAAELPLAPMRLITASGETLTLGAEGRVDALSKGKSRQVGWLKPDGVLLRPDGSLLVRLTPEGKILRAGGSELPVILAQDGTAEAPGQKLFFNDDNILEGGSPGAPEVRVEGGEKISRRTAMFLLILAAFPVGD